MGTTPLLRWQRDIEHIRQLPPATDLRRLCFHRLDRLVRRDSTFLLHNRLYETPLHLTGHTVEVRFDPVDNAQVEIWFQGKLEATAQPVGPLLTASCVPSNPRLLPSPRPPASTSSNCSTEKKDIEDQE